MEKVYKTRKLRYLLSIFFFWIGFSANAEFTETSINQTLIGVSSINIDIDGDLNDDIRFEIIEISPNNYASRITSIGLAGYMDKSVSGYPDALTFGEPVSGPFLSGNGILGMATTSANFSEAGDRYIGLKISSGGNFYFAWILVNCNATNDTLLILKSASNNLINDPIVAGQTGANSDIEDVAIASFSIYPNPCNTNLTIRSDFNESYFSYTIYNSVGKIVLIDDYNLAIDVSVLKSGIYFIEIKSEGISTKKKFIVNR